MDKLPFVVLTRDIDDPSDTPQDYIRQSYLRSTKTIRSLCEMAVVVRNTDLLPTIEGIPLRKKAARKRAPLNSKAHPMIRVSVPTGKKAKTIMQRHQKHTLR